MSVNHHRCWAQVDLAALERNVGRIRSVLPAGVHYISVVKADAYGHGVGKMVMRLMHAGVDAFAVANVREAAQLREIAQGWPILILSPLLPYEDEALLDYDLIACLSSREELERFAALGQARGQPVRVHLKVDTGMGRVGVWHEEAAQLFEAIRRNRWVSLEGICTHFSSADSDAQFTRLQRERFNAVLEKLNLSPQERAALFIHADNSAGIDSFVSNGPFNAVRVGLLQLGLRPCADSLLGRIFPEPVLSLHTRVSLVKELPAGTPISYSQTFVLKRPTQVAVLSLGYADGLGTAASNRGQVLIGGQRCPLIGRVTMDQAMADVSHLQNLPQAGDEAVLIGTQGQGMIDLQEYSQWSQKVAWESLCSLSKRVPRIYAASRKM